MKHVALLVALLLGAWQAADARQPLPAVSPPEGGKAYRLIAVSYAGESTVVTVVVVRAGRPDVTSTQRRRPRVTRQQIAALEAALAEARFASLATDPPPSTLPLGAVGACPGFPSWSLEAATGEHRHVVVGTACDRRGLRNAINLMLRFGGAPAWP